MRKKGVSCFCDFREGGLEGIYQIKNAMKDSHISSLILSRPKDQKFKKNIIESLLINSDGLGISSISDWDYQELKKIANYVKIKDKIFNYRII